MPAPFPAPLPLNHSKIGVEKPAPAPTRQSFMRVPSPAPGAYKQRTNILR